MAAMIPVLETACRRFPNVMRSHCLGKWHFGKVCLANLLMRPAKIPENVPAGAIRLSWKQALSNGILPHLSGPLFSG
jgi:hypothetical protein